MAATRTSPSCAGCLRAMHHAINFEFRINFELTINRPYPHSSQAHARKHESEARVDKTNMADTADIVEKPTAKTLADIPWSKSLENLLVFTKEIDIHRNKSGKRRADDVGTPIKKTLKRGAKFQEERYLSSDSVYTKVFNNAFMVKAKCRASMSTREIHDLEVSLAKPATVGTVTM